MERYTKRLSNGQASWNYPSACYDENETRNKVFKSVHRQKACEKLAAYEATGLEPEEINSLQAEWGVNLKALESYRRLGSFDRLSELSEADKEGRIVVFPAEAINARHDVADILEDWKQEAEFEDTSVGIYGFTWAESMLFEAIIDALNKEAQP